MIQETLGLVVRNLEVHRGTVRRRKREDEVRHGCDDKYPPAKSVPEAYEQKENRQVRPDSI